MKTKLATKIEKILKANGMPEGNVGIVRTELTDIFLNVCDELNNELMRTYSKKAPKVIYKLSKAFERVLNK